MRTSIRVGVFALMLASTASFSGPLEDGTAAFDRGDYATAIRLFKPLAERGDADAQYNLGVMYRDGQGVPPDDEQAVQWYRKAAARGSAPAQTNLGVMYANGRGVPQDDAEAAQWYRKAADQGFARAQSNLGAMYAKGRGVPQDDTQAMQWLRKAADQGHAAAQFNLGVMYRDGQGVPPDDAQAMQWFRKAADQGDVNAQHNLGVMYDGGQGAPRDDAEALKRDRKSVEHSLSGTLGHYVQAHIWQFIFGALLFIMGLAALTRNLLLEYLKSHWRGEHSLARSFFVNGVLVYLIVVVVVVGLGTLVESHVNEKQNQLSMIVGLSMFALVMLWSFVGNVRAASGAIRAPNSFTRKFFAVVIVILIVLAIVSAMFDILRLGGL